MIKRDYAYLGLLALLSCVFLWPLLPLQNVWYQEDFAPQVMPYFHWLHLKYSQGLRPIFSSQVLCGYPFFEEGLTGAFYAPFRLILTCFDYAPATLLDSILHFYIGALGFYVLARQRGIGPDGSLIAAVIGAFSGAVIFSLHSWVVLTSLAWFPWILLGYFLCVKSGTRLQGALLLGLATSFSILGGHLGFAIYSMLILGCFYALHLAAKFEFKNELKNGAAFSVAGLLAGLMAGGQLQATANFVRQSARSQPFNYAMASENSLSPASLIHILLPYAFGDNNDGSFLGHSWPLGSWLHQGMPLYIGALALGLAWLGLRGKGGAYAWPALVITGYALGSYFVVHRILFHLPLLSHFRAPMKSAVFVPLLLALPAGWGFEALQSDSSRLRRFLLGVLGLYALAFVGIWLLSPWLMAEGKTLIEARVLHQGAHVNDLGYYLGKLTRWMGRLKGHLAEQGIFIVAALAWLSLGARRGAVVLALLLFCEYSWHGARYQPLILRSYYDQAPESALQLQALVAESKTPARFVSWGWGDLLMKSFPKGRLGGDAEGEFKLREILGGDANLFYGLNHFRGYTPLGLENVAQLMDGKVDYNTAQSVDSVARDLLERRQVLNEGSVKFIVSSMPLEAKGLKLRSSKPVHIYENKQAWEMARLENGEAVSARFSRCDDEAWELDLTMKKAGRLQLARAYENGAFLALVDDSAAPIVPSGKAWTGLELTAGKHRVKIVSDPAPYDRALRLHALGWALAAFLMILAFRKRAW